MADLGHLPGPVADLWEWQYEGRCRSIDTDVFYHPEGERGAARRLRETAAKEICAACPVVAACRAHALTTRETFGVWGGMTEDEREHQLARAALAG